MSGFEAHMDKTLFANLKLSDGREAQARELLDDKIHRLGGAAPYLSAANDDLIQEVAADLAEAKRFLAKARAPSLRRLLSGFARKNASRELKLLNGDAAPAPAVDVAPAAGDVAALAAELAEAKRLLARAARPAVKKLAASFVRKTAARELELLNGDGDAPAAAATKLQDAAPPAPRKKQGPAPQFPPAPSRLEPKPARTPTLDDDDAGELAFDGGVPVDPRLRIPGEERKLEALMAKIDLTKPPAKPPAKQRRPPARFAPERPPSEGLKKVAAQAPAVVRAPAVPKDVEFSYNPTASPGWDPSKPDYTPLHERPGDRNPLADKRNPLSAFARKPGAAPATPTPAAAPAKPGAVHHRRAAAADRARDRAAERSAAAEKAVRRAAPPAGTAGEAVAARADEPAAAAATEAEEAAPAARYALKKNRDAVAGEMLRDLEAMKGAAAEAIYVEGIAAGRDAEASEARARAEAKAAEEEALAAAFHRATAPPPAPKPAPKPAPAPRRRRPPGPDPYAGLGDDSDDEVYCPPPRPLAGGGGGGAPRKIETAAPAAAEGPVFTPITKFGWDQGDEHSAWVNVVVGLAGVEDAAKVTCDVQTDAFDLKVLGLRGANYRLKKTALDDDVVPSASRHVVKSGRVTVKLHKKPRKDGDGKTTYPAWTALTCAGGDKEKAKRSAPRFDGNAGGLAYDVCKNLYDSGDPDVRARVGEAITRNRDRVFADGTDDPLEDILKNMPEGARTKGLLDPAALLRTQNVLAGKKHVRDD